MPAQLDLNAIQKLCSPQVQNAIAKQQAGKYASGVTRPNQTPVQPVYTQPMEVRQDSGFDDPYLMSESTEPSYNSPVEMPSENDSMTQAQYNAKLSQMNLPEAIKKSLMEQQAVLQDAPAPKAGDAIEQMLARNGITATQQNKLANVQSPIMVEQRAPAAPVSAYMQQPQPQSFDFQTLRLVINECLDAKLKELKTLNESKLTDIVLKEGKIRLIDNKGNVYVAPLQKQGNINDKK